MTTVPWQMAPLLRLPLLLLLLTAPREIHAQFCSSHSECLTGFYCDLGSSCYTCTFISPTTCDAVDNDCCRWLSSLSPLHPHRAPTPRTPPIVRVFNFFVLSIHDRHLDHQTPAFCSEEFLGQCTTNPHNCPPPPAPAPGDGGDDADESSSTGWTITIGIFAAAGTCASVHSTVG